MQHHQRITNPICALYGNYRCSIKPKMDTRCGRSVETAEGFACCLPSFSQVRTIHGIDDLLQKRHYQMPRISSASIKNASLPEQKNGKATPFSTLKFFYSKITLCEKTDAILNEDGRDKNRNQGFERAE